MAGRTGRRSGEAAGQEGFCCRNCDIPSDTTQASRKILRAGIVTLRDSSIACRERLVGRVPLSRFEHEPTPTLFDAALLPATAATKMGVHVAHLNHLSALHLRAVEVRMYQSRLIAIFLGLLTCMSCGTGRLVADNGGPPVEQTFDVSWPAGYQCALPVHLTGPGKAKTITLSGDRFILTAPDLFATVNNVNHPSKNVTLNITGAAHLTQMPDGSIVWRFTGRNLNADPRAAGFVLFIGNFTVVYDAAGNPTQPLSGTGQMSDICAMIE